MPIYSSVGRKLELASHDGGSTALKLLSSNATSSEAKLSRIEAARADLRTWGQTGSPWPAAADGLLDIVTTGFAESGIDLATPSGEPDGSFIEAFFLAAKRFSGLELETISAARIRAPAEAVRNSVLYHWSHVEQRAEPFGTIERAWDNGPREAIRISFAELITHLALAFARHGRVTQCGEAGRDLLTGPIEHDGPNRFQPARPFYRYAGDCMAEVTLNFGLPIFVDTTDDSVSPDIITTGWWEPWIDGLVRRCLGPGDVGVNVGANVGYYTLLMARRVQAKGRVFSFEPNPRLALLIMRSLRWGGLLGTVKIHQMAASDRQGSVTFAADRHFMGAGTMVDSEVATRLVSAPTKLVLNARMPRRTNVEVHEVEMARLDDVLGNQVSEIHMMLIDTEGAEPLVLEGAKDLIRRSRDLAMVVEWSGARVAKAKNRTAEAAAIVGWLASEGFKFWKIMADTRDKYARPAMLTLMTPDQLLEMEDYADIFVSRHGARLTPPLS